VTAAPAADQVWREAYATCPSEVDEELPIVEGALPSGLRGVLYRNGPGRMEAGGVRYQHPFDGDGLVLRFAFESAGPGVGRVRYRNRFVRTRELMEEARAGRMLYRTFGTNLPGGLRRNALRMRIKNAANTSVVMHGGRLLALWEGGAPHALDPITLETLGRHTFDGRLINRASDRLLAPELAFSAHPRLDPATGELWNFGAVAGWRGRLQLYRVDGGGAMEEPEAVPLEPFSFVHDFALTPRWRIFFLTPVAFAPFRVLAGLETPAESIRGDEARPVTVLMVPRERGGAARAVRLQAPPAFLFHFAGAWEEERDGSRVIVDGMRFDRFPAVDDLLPREGRTGAPAPRLTRWTIDVKRQRVAEEPLGDHPMELPRTDADGDGRPHRTVFAVARAPESPSWHLTGIAAVDVGAARPVTRFRDFAPDLPGEPIFVRATDGRGLLLTLVYRARARRSELVVLDAGDLSTVCVARLPHHVPPGFHGTFVPAASSPSS
jgi:all-trans-8'-apo-beta-carotenal 15,15'-oxygenase